MNALYAMILSRLRGPLALAKSLVFWGAAVVVLYGSVAVLVAVAPGFFAASVGGSAVLYLAAVGLAFLLFRSYQALARQERMTQAAVELGEARHEIGHLEGENRLLDLKARLMARLTELEAARKLEREVNQREKKIEKLVLEGRLAELRHRTTFAGLQAELEYYKREHHRLFKENRWLKSSLRQNHVDLAYLKEHVERFLTLVRPSLMDRVKSLFSRSSPSPALIHLVRTLESRRPGEPAPGGGPRLIGPIVPAR